MKYLFSTALLLVLLTATTTAQEVGAPETAVSSDDAAVAGVETDGIEAFEGDPGTVESEPVTEAADAYQELIELPALRAPYEFEPAGIAPPTIIGPDNRVLVTPTTGFPARAVVLITMSGGRCSGFLYGKDVVATAGHCVHSGGSSGAWMTNIRVFPGRDGAAAPYSSCGAKQLYSVLGWTRDGDKNYDYGVIKLDCSVGSRVGWFGLYWTTGNLVGTPTIINGYPGDKPLTQWQSSDQVRVAHPLKLFYLNDTVGGVSGSGVYYRHPTFGFAAIAVHTNGTHNGPPWNSHNAGTRITKERFDNMIRWRDAP
jgi:glutamyl endopeptidase